MKITALLFALLAILFISPQTNAPAHAQSSSIIPEPAELIWKPGTFKLKRSTPIIVPGGDAAARRVAEYLSDRLYTATWIRTPLKSHKTERDSAIILTLDPALEPANEEAYSLSVNPSEVHIRARTGAGLFYGMQTLLQLLPPEIELDDPSLVPQHVQWSIPSVEIVDYPRFSYRGMHLDVARHFFPVPFIKKYLDLMARQKMNRFHWHLTEDQGWRIEIKQYPRLTEIGAWRDSTLIGHYGTGIYDGIRYGGFYTQEEIREIVQYAEDRFITVIPEIEMPGHSSAALAAYPELGCHPDKEYQVQTTWGVFEDIYCPTEHTFSFLENVLDEVMSLFPGSYIHIGGDEAPKVAWENSEKAQEVIKREGLEGEEELQSYFITRIEKYLNSKGRKIIGWDEILEGGLAPNATVMSWRGVSGGVEAAKQGHDVIMTPWSFMYLDHYQADPETEPLAIGGFTTLEKIYHYDPVPSELGPEEAGHVLGAQGNVWTEYMHTGEKVEYMAWPRSLALSEVLWSPKTKRDWYDFWGRLQPHFERLEYLDVNAAEHYRGRIPVIINR
ncbi:MAG: beta-N-acetylhexosaminidase [Balneolaceae bacterium]|nr:beta-N-acetylhexosaminidase [Balneolaceae bacterium]